MKKNNSNKKALSIIEVMIGIFIFTLGISAVYMVISSTSKINTYNKNQIIAGNLAREQIELIRNIRDTNYEKLQKWNTLRPLSGNYTDVFTGSTTHFYKLESDLGSGYGSGKINVSTELGVGNFEAALKNTSILTEDTYRLCFDSLNRYRYCPSPLTSGFIETPFYRYIEIQKYEEKVAGSTPIPVDNALKIRSRVFWNQKGIHDLEVPTILTDWKRL